MSFVYYLALVAFMVFSVLLCFVILIQESKSMGMGASFGGDAGDAMFGTSTADVLKRFTGWLAVIFMLACVVMSLWTSAIGRSRSNTSVTIEAVKNG